MWCFNQMLSFLLLHDMWLCICLQITSFYDVQMYQHVIMRLVISVSLALWPLPFYLWWNCKCSCFRFQLVCSCWSSCLMWTSRETKISQKVRIAPTFMRFFSQYYVFFSWLIFFTTLHYCRLSAENRFSNEQRVWWRWQLWQPVCITVRPKNTTPLFFCFSDSLPKLKSKI